MHDFEVIVVLLLRPKIVLLIPKMFSPKMIVFINPLLILYHCVIWLHIKNHAVLGFTPDRVPCVMLKIDVKSFLISKSNNTSRYVGVI